MISSCSASSSKKCSHYSFRDFVDSGGDEASSPFLNPQAQALSFWMGIPLTLLSGLILLFSFSLDLLHFESAWSMSLVTVVYFLSGTRALQGAIEDLTHLHLNIDVLMTLAAYLCAYMGSAFEGALLLVLFDISRGMEKSVTAKARSSMMSMRDMVPERVYVIEKGSNPKICHIQDIKVGMHILVKAGETVPLDGKVCQGSSNVSLAHLTGESLPKRVGINDIVSSGARALDGSLEIEVLKPVQETTLTQIIKLIHEAQEAKPKLEQTFDHLGNTYAKTIIVLSGLLAAIMPLFLSVNYLGFDGSIYRALTFLIAASPCALVLAVPIAYLSALSACSNKGIILKGGSIFDRLFGCKAVAFDKTGTLTYANLSVDTITHIGIRSSDFESAIVALEQSSSHPLAEALCQHYSEQKAASIDHIQMLASRGMSAQFQANPIRIGQAEFALEIVSDELKAQALVIIQTLKEAARVYCIASQPTQVLIYTFKDQLRSRTKEMIQDLNKLGLKSYMLTGDHQTSALKAAQAVGVQETFYELSPEQKVNKVRELSLKHPLAMVGDGINDAPALAQATVGIAMGGLGSPAASYAADVLLLNDDITQLPWLFDKSRRVRFVIWQNLVLAAATIILASFSALLGIIPLWAAVLSHEGGTILVGLNGLRLMKSKNATH
jgi:Cd2+/Zn2+-exporting ATPase